MKPKYIPDMATVLRETDPQKRKRDHQRAMENAERPTPPMFWREPAPRESAAEVDEDALPSAVGPERQAPASRRGRARRSWMIVAACVAVGIVMPVVLVALGGRRERDAGARAPDAGAAASAPVVPSAMPTTTAPATPSAAASSSAAASPSASPSVEREAPSAPTSRPRSRSAPRQETSDPYVPAPAPPKTTEPPPAPPPKPEAID